MLERLNEEKDMVRFLLGDLPDQERASLEERFFADDDVFSQLLAVEDELIDSYARNQLSGRERQQFEKNYLHSPERRERVAFAVTMAQAFAERRAPAIASITRPAHVSPWQQNRAVWMPLAATLVVGVLAGVWLLAENARLQNRVEMTRTEKMALEQKAEQTRREIEQQRGHNEQLSAELASQQQRIEELEQELQKLRQAPTTGQTVSEIASIFLPYTSVRGAGKSRTLTLKPETKTAKLSLALETSEYKSYRAVIQTLEGVNVDSKDGLKASDTASGAVVTVSLPSSLLPAGDYQVTLSGITPSGTAERVGDYYFRVVKK